MGQECICFCFLLLLRLLPGLPHSRLSATIIKGNVCTFLNSASVSRNGARSQWHSRGYRTNMCQNQSLVLASDKSHGQIAPPVILVAAKTISCSKVADLQKLLLEEYDAMEAMM